MLTPANPTPLPLRERAAARLSSGRVEGHAQLGGALAVLHQLASSPATAADALAMLHELQVHQIEIELQSEELRSARAELEGALAHQLARIDAAPVGLFTVDPGTVVHEVNAPGARLLGLGADELLGLALTQFLSAQDADALATLLSLARDRSSHEGCALRLQPPVGAPVAVRATAARLSDDGQCQLALMRVAA